jgi:hypothetical protein
MKFLATFWILAVALFTSGCAHVSETLMLHKLDTGTLSTRAPWDGEYQLWEVRSPGNEHLIQTCKLKSGDPIGFDCAEGLVAVGGNNRWVLKPANYAWERSISEGEVAAWTSLKIVLVPVMAGAMMGGGGP